MADPVQELLDEYRAALSKAAALGAEAEHLEEMRKVVLAEQYVLTVPEWKNDAAARVSQSYRNHLKQLWRVKAEAAEAKGVVIHIAMRLEVWRTRESSRRAQLQQRSDR